MKRIWLIGYSVISVLNLVLLPLNCFCYEKNDHAALCNFVSDKTIDGFSFDQYLKHNLGFDLGKDQYFTEAPIMALFWFGIFAKEPVNAKECLAQGARDEDSPVIRCKNHFHDPSMTWDLAGLNRGEGLEGGKSSILWAQLGQGTQDYGAYSWHDARQYFYKALTTTDPNEKGMNLMMTFQAVGHLMHLIQDASVPEHVRDNSHITGYNYEKYVSVYCNPKSDKYNTFLNWLNDNTRYTFNDSAFSLPSNSEAPIPIARIVDTDRYSGTNPSITMEQPIGISEYTNANYFSKDTVFTLDKYPFPDWGSVNSSAVIIQNPRDSSGEIHRQYLLKVQDGDAGYRLCTAPILAGQVPDTAEYLAPMLDDSVYGDYAARLVPRAVSYSAGLLKYFFRGTLEISLPASGVYAFTSTEPADPRSKGFNKVSLMVKNSSSSGEPMNGGAIELVVQYRFLTNNPNTDDPRSAALDPFVMYPASNLPALSKPIYLVKALDSNNDHDISSTAPQLLEFNLDNDEIPLWAIDVRLYVVYKGKLGTTGSGGYEEESAVCVGYKNINEPTSLDIINDTDTVCKNDEWCEASDVENVKPKYITSFYLRFSPEAQPQDASPAEGEHIYALSNINPGKYKRVYLLSDNTYSESVHYSYHFAGESDIYEGSSTYQRTAIKNGIYRDESNDTVIRYYPIFNDFRNITYWNMFYFLNFDICTLSSCPEGCDNADNPFDLESMP